MMVFYSQKEMKVKSGDIRKDFYSIGVDINVDGKHQYADKLVKKQALTDTLTMGADKVEEPYPKCKIH
eukprot:CAMPEP_0202963914 /NCGR_PEP_ID=MMETSP1396-20130829/7968_1 /ASSEMBLY_ACC=CAM_ASM_000872 /TAXON_ID= /ORGANISM="Pseudokeronopsis sp., Strain Brazil" /LENGTH=67 /DNA_ID=CAMNT_0049685571 /DNA_START=480 /DNA_END=683 /DNA_ORIENTATION=+